MVSLPSIATGGSECAKPPSGGHKVVMHHDRRGGRSQVVIRIHGEGDHRAVQSQATAELERRGVRITHSGTVTGDPPDVAVAIHGVHEALDYDRGKKMAEGVLGALRKVHADFGYEFDIIQ